MEFTVSGTTKLRFDERTMQFALRATVPNGIPALISSRPCNARKAPSRSQMPLPSPMSSVKPAREPAFAASSPALELAYSHSNA